MVLPMRRTRLNSGYSFNTDQRRTKAGTIAASKHFMERSLNQFSSTPLWTPAQISTSLWLDAADTETITLNGSTVSQWNDKSGNGRNASQGTAALQPAYTVNGLNGKPVITLTQDELAVSNLVLTGRGWDAFAVATLASTSNSFARLLSLRQSGQANDFNNAGSWIPIYRDGSSSNIGTYQNGSGPSLFNSTLGVPYIINSQLLANSLVFAVYGQVVGVKNASFDLNTTDGLLIGQSLQYLDENWDGILGEVIFANGLQTTDREKIEGYLAWKWGLTSNLPANHPYKNAAP